MGATSTDHGHPDTVRKGAVALVVSRRESRENLLHHTAHAAAVAGRRERMQQFQQRIDDLPVQRETKARRLGHQGQFFGRQVFAKGGKPTNVGKENGNKLPVPAQAEFRGVVGQAINHGGRYITAEHILYSS